jgi:alpha-galactosidase
MNSRIAFLALGLSLGALMIGTATADTVWLDQLDIRSAAQGWGEPHKNQSVQGNPLTIGGKTFARGFGTHAESILHVNLGGDAQSFSASVGVDDEVSNNPTSSVEFFVIGDGQELWNSGVMHAGDAPKDCAVNLSGVKASCFRCREMRNSPA